MWTVHHRCWKGNRAESLGGAAALELSFRASLSFQITTCRSEQSDKQRPDIFDGALFLCVKQGVSVKKAAWARSTVLLLIGLSAATCRPDCCALANCLKSAGATLAIGGLGTVAGALLSLLLVGCRLFVLQCILAEITAFFCHLSGGSGILLYPLSYPPPLTLKKALRHRRRAFGCSA